MALVVFSSGVYAQGSGETGATIATDGEILVRPIRTDSPKQTLRSFVLLKNDLEADLGKYFVEKTPERQEKIAATLLQMTTLIDLSRISPAARRDTGIDTVGYLLDIFGRTSLPNFVEVPDAESIENDETITSYLIPNTPFRIVQQADGDLAGEYLFSRKTIGAAPDFLRVIERIPLYSTLNIESWSDLLPQLTGWMIPNWLEAAVPDPLKVTILDTPAWKEIAVIVLALLAFPLFASLHRLLGIPQKDSRLGNSLVLSLWPVSLLICLTGLQVVFDVQINLTGRFAILAKSTVVVLKSLAGTYLLWLLLRVFFEWIIRSPKIPEESLNASMLRLLARMLGVAGGIIIIAFGAQEIGLPVFSILAGLGIGGLAIALAIRPTLENLIGGLILYIDKPVRVGDLCEFGGTLGWIEKIGVRSTKIRARNRTLISIPNAQFADMQLINWASCDEMLITHVIGLRYETDGDQLRHVLAGIREMLIGHPMIASETVRVRFIGYGTSSLDIEIRVYAKTRDFNEFYAIREDIFLRIKDIVGEAGTTFAFPSVTMYTSTDEGLDEERTKTAKKDVAAWRRAGRLPFPNFAASQIERTRGTLDYPPRGSVELGAEITEDVSAEPLGSDAEDDETK